MKKTGIINRKGAGRPNEKELSALLIILDKSLTKQRVSSGELRAHGIGDPNRILRSLRKKKFIEPPQGTGRQTFYVPGETPKDWQNEKYLKRLFKAYGKLLLKYDLKERFKGVFEKGKGDFFINFYLEQSEKIKKETLSHVDKAGKKLGLRPPIYALFITYFQQAGKGQVMDPIKFFEIFKSILNDWKITPKPKEEKTIMILFNMAVALENYHRIGEIQKE